jgi:hypothetical protein
MTMFDSTAFELISNAAQERLKYLLEQVKLVAQHRIDISMKVEFDLIFNINLFVKYYLE